MNTESFLAVNVGCNKAQDAVALAGILSQDPTFQPKNWMKSLGTVAPAICGSPSVHFYDDAPRRSGKVHCIEPTPDTFASITNALKMNPNFQSTLVLKQAAMSNVTGTVLFPDVLAGLEAYSIADCYRATNEDLKCKEVPLLTVDEYMENEEMGKSSQEIDILLIDAEGFDWEVIQGARNAISQSKYVMFEVHMNGNWMQHSLVGTVENTFHEFNCYWVGRDKLWRITNCMDDELKEIYEFKSWSNVACVRRSELDLARQMESIFLRTHSFYSQAENLHVIDY
jgi:FkbM family methyltransferase